SGEWIIRFFLFVMVHLVSDCTHLTQCPKLLVRIKRMGYGYRDTDYFFLKIKAAFPGKPR
ncbi:TPA: hypothetical protein ACVU5D_003191, partial [Vibrio parahaemolyticus]